jgi:hypothetical protein
MKKIENERNYSIRSIWEMQLFPDATSIPTIRNRVLRDMEGENILQTNIMYVGKNKLYMIKGINLKKYIKKNYARN